MHDAKQKVIYASLCLAFLVAWSTGCATNAPLYDATIPAGEGLVVVRHFTMDLAPPEYTGPTDFGVIMAEYIAGALQELGLAAVAIPSSGSVPPGADFESRGDLLEVDPGSWNLRFWVSPGVGMAAVMARAELLGSDGERISGMERRARSSTWQREESILRRTCARVARTIAKDLRVDIVAGRRRAPSH